MKQVRPAMLAAIVLAILTQGFSPINTNTGVVSRSAKFNENQFRSFLWMKPLPNQNKNYVARHATVYLSFISYASANVTINYVALGDPTYYGSGNYPVASGNIGYSTYEDGSTIGPVYVSITITGPTPDPNAIRTLYLTDGLSTYCQEINGSSVYTFYNVMLGSSGTITADVGGCN